MRLVAELQASGATQVFDHLVDIQINPGGNSMPSARAVGRSGGLAPLGF
jgi:hypothetical protein